MNKNKPVLEINNVNFSYGSSKILENINLKIFPGDFLAIIGPNGGGKSTLLKLILGLIKPETGNINIHGKKNIYNLKKTGYVPQEINNKYFPISVFDVVNMGFLCTDIENREKRSREILDMLGIADLYDKKISDISGGERQKVYIARALVSEPDLLFLDEPVSNIDIETQIKIYDLLKELNKTITIIMVSHDLDLLLKYSKSFSCVNKNMCYHNTENISEDIMRMIYKYPVNTIERLIKEHSIHFPKGDD